MNELLFFAQLIICFGSVVVLNKLFGKNGVFAYIAIAVVLANIETACLANLFGLPDNTVFLGTVTFASVYLATDILNECYSYKDSKKGVIIGIIAAVLFLGLIQLDILYKPASDSYMHELLTAYFGLDGVFIWVTISSVVMFFLSNLLDVWLFQKIKKATKSKFVWLRNNVATIVANCLENFLFCFFGYYLLPLIFAGGPIMPIGNAAMLALTTCAIEVIVSLLDTPFLYAAKKWSYKDKDLQNAIEAK